jgi:hypothetical protein
MQRTMATLFAAAILLSPALASAQSTAPGKGKTNGTGYNHTNGPTTTGQPNQSCEDSGTTPGNSADAPGSAFNPDGKAGSVYAGEQQQNSRNSASVSQYDVACSNQPPR